ncbi:type II toxin-antitoxin system HicB family antitoxin [Novosphingobium huizhouense]|uniref:type II toxin-antitoxin system HicB family antitoxin n=1 Tax=Novosphingobium huizhouense TaxID=2866625 RepID=UPI001CD859E9|nr:type II toxin-antitoxin system HicB family antitoxin [Novosphingobium huizhouense]
MTAVFYPAVIEQAGEGYSVYFPDLPGCTSAGATLREAALNAEEALSGHIAVSAQYGDPVPAPSEVLPREPDAAACLLVRAELPGKALRINITLDEGLVAAIDRVARNRSGFLAEAARDKLAARRALG